MMRLNSAMFAASRRKSSSSRMFASKSSTMPTGFASSPRGETAIARAPRRKTRRSASTTRVDARPLHLDDDVLAVVQARGVHLRDRRRRERLRDRSTRRPRRGRARAPRGACAARPRTRTASRDRGTCETPRSTPRGRAPGSTRRAARASCTWARAPRTSCRRIAGARLAPPAQARPEHRSARLGARPTPSPARAASCASRERRDAQHADRDPDGERAAGEGSRRKRKRQRTREREARRSAPRARDEARPLPLHPHARSPAPRQHDSADRAGTVFSQGRVDHDHFDSVMGVIHESRCITRQGPTRRISRRSTESGRSGCDRGAGTPCPGTGCRPPGRAPGRGRCRWGGPRRTRGRGVDDVHALHDLAERGEARGVEACVVGEVDEDLGRARVGLRGLGEGDHAALVRLGRRDRP